MSDACVAAIFDLDGTILDSMTYWRRINLEYIRDMGFTTPLEMRGRETAFSTHRAALLYRRDGLTERSVEEIVADYEARMLAYYRAEIQPKPGVARFLAALAARGVKLCVATMTPREIAEEALARHGLLDRFEFVLSGDPEGFSKRDAGYFRLVARRLGVAPGDCCVFEDALYALRGARAAGCGRLVGVADPVSAADRDEILRTADLFYEDWPDAAPPFFVGAGDAPKP